MTETPPSAVLSRAVGDSWEQVARASFGSDTQPKSIAELSEWVVFRIGNERYAIVVDQVRQIVRMQPLTPIPRVPPEVVGVASLRGEIVQVMDMRMRLGRKRRMPDKNARILVLRGDGYKVCGLIVDEVQHVLRVPISQLRPAVSESGSMVNALYQYEGRLISLLDVSRIMELREDD